jgi:hypothetical protein
MTSFFGGGASGIAGFGFGLGFSRFELAVLDPAEPVRASLPPQATKPSTAQNPQAHIGAFMP